MGMAMCSAHDEGTAITDIPHEYIEVLAEQEHEAWVKERIASGWTAGPSTDEKLKLTPYLIPYNKLPDEIKQLDRDPIENIPILLARIGMKAVKRA